MLPGVWKMIFGCSLFCFSYANTLCIENYFIASGVEYSFTDDMT